MSNKLVAPQVATIVLAAGTSSRLGRSKQLLPYRGTTLLRHVVQTALAAPCHPVVVVIPVQQDIHREIADLDVHIVENRENHQGMAGSLCRGITVLDENPQIAAALVLLCDQPLISVSLLQEIFQAYVQTGKSIVACEYGGGLGVPALFSRSLFPELLRLEGDRGAKAVIRRYCEEVTAVAFAQGVVDIDTTQDYRQCLDEENGATL